MLDGPKTPRHHWRLILSVAAGVLAVVGVGELVCGVYAAAAGGDASQALLLAGGGTVLVAVLAEGISRHLRRGAVRARDGFLAVTFAWLVAAAAGAAPYVIEGTLPRAIDALFESMSGFTTTGATLIDDVDGQPDGVLLWRSVTQWLGGLGIVVLVVAAAPAAGAAMQRVFQAETSGVPNDRLTPRIADTAKILWGIYVVFTLAGVVAYAFAGMGWFDAVNHAFTSLASGGFSTRTASIAAFDSVAVESVAICLMVVTSINYALYWRLLRRGAIWPQAAEARTFLLILAFVIAGVAASLVLADHPGGDGRAVRDAAFTVTSVISTTGYTTADFDAWNDTARGLLLLTMLLGGCAGSTAGGLKVFRAMLIAKTLSHELQRQLRPSAIRVLRVRGHVFPPDTGRAVNVFLVTFVLVAGAATFLLLLSGLDLETSIGAVAASITLVGPGLGDVGASENFQAVGDPARALLATLMLIGRLELFAVLVLLTPGFWRRGVA